jgi:hypothetical protein
LPNSPSEEVANAPEEEKKDSGLGLEWLWINVEGGYSFADLASFNESKLALQSTKSSGGVAGIAAGVRFLSLSVGLHMRDIPLSVGNVVEFDGELGFHTRISHADFYIGLRGGYLFSGNLSPDTVKDATVAGGSPPNVTIHGGNAGLMVGFDHYFNHFLSLGIDINPEAMFIQRPPATPPKLPTAPPGGCPPPAGAPPQLVQACTTYTNAMTSYNAVINSPVYKESGSSIGFGFIASGHLGVHF